MCWTTGLGSANLLIYFDDSRVSWAKRTASIHHLKASDRSETERATQFYLESHKKKRAATSGGLFSCHLSENTRRVLMAIRHPRMMEQERKRRGGTGRKKRRKSKKRRVRSSTSRIEDITET